MHIAEGVLSAPVWAGGAALAAGGVALGLRKMDPDRVPQVAVLASAFFVASLVHVPIGPSNAHLVLNGLLGIILGWASFPAMLMALFLQTILFQFGGLTALGVNTFNMAVPAVVSHYLFRRAVRRWRPGLAAGAGFLAGSLPILMSAALMMLALRLTGKALAAPAWLVFYWHVPVMAIEGAITASVVVFIRRVRPELLSLSLVEGGHRVEVP